MKTRCVAILVALLVAACPTVAAADSPSASVERFKTNGYALGFFGDCPQVPVEEVPPGTVCRDNFVLLINESVAIDGGGLAPPKTPWVVVVYGSTLTFGAVDRDPVESDVRWGVVVGPTGLTYDREHLMFASIHTEVGMSDGTTADVDVHWQGISDRLVSGNDGSGLGEFGRLKHAVDKCSTQVTQAHQKGRVAAMSGTIDGVPVNSYTGAPSAWISFNHFVFIDVTHGPRCA